MSNQCNDRAGYFLIISFDSFEGKSGCPILKKIPPDSAWCACMQVCMYVVRYIRSNAEFDSFVGEVASSRRFEIFTSSCLHFVLCFGLGHHRSLRITWPFFPSSWRSQSTSTVCPSRPFRSVAFTPPFLRRTPSISLWSESSSCCPPWASRWRCRRASRPLRRCRPLK